MQTMLKITSTQTFPEAAPAASDPCRHTSLADGRRVGNALPLAERCAR